MAKRKKTARASGGGGDRRTIVTGASSGIGEAFARALHDRGHRLVLVARRADRLKKLAEELGGEDEAAVIPQDLGKPGAGTALREAVAERGFEVEVLVNNAGFGHTGAFHAEPLEKQLGMIDLNVRATVDLCHAFLPDMVKNGGGGVINVVSTSAFQPVPFLAVYAASKCFLLSFTEGLAVELRGTGVRVQALCPGLTATEFQDVARTDRVLFNKTGTMTPAQVAESSLDAWDRGTLIVIPGWQNKVVTNLQGFLPRSLVRNVAGQLFKPRSE